MEKERNVVTTSQHHLPFTDFFLSFPLFFFSLSLFYSLLFLYLFLFLLLFQLFSPIIRSQSYWQFFVSVLLFSTWCTRWMTGVRERERGREEREVKESSDNHETIWSQSFELRDAPFQIRNSQNFVIDLSTFHLSLIHTHTLSLSKIWKREKIEFYTALKQLQFINSSNKILEYRKGSKATLSVLLLFFPSLSPSSPFHCVDGFMSYPSSSSASFFLQWREKWIWREGERKKKRERKKKKRKKVIIICRMYKSSNK